MNRIRILASGCALAMAFGLGAVAPAAALEPGDTYPTRIVIDEADLPETYDFNLGYYSGDADDDRFDAFADAVVPDCSSVSGSASAWFEFTPSQDGRLKLDARSEYGNWQMVAEGPLDDLTDMLVCGRSNVTIPVTAGTVYTITIREFVGDPEATTLAVEFFPEASIDVTVDRLVGLDPKSGTATVRGTYVCENGSGLRITADLAQAKGKQKRSPSGVGGFALPDPVCDRASHPWSARVTPTGGVFTAGPAAVTVTAVVKDELGLTYSDTVSNAAAKLRPAKALR